MNGRAIDELGDNVYINHLDPFADIQLGPSGRSSFSSRQQGGDVRHRNTFSGVVELPAGFQMAPIFRFHLVRWVGILQPTCFFVFLSHASLILVVWSSIDK
jgi:hypothetical protein